MEQLRMKLQRLNQRASGLSYKPQFCVEAKERPWPGTAVVMAVGDQSGAISQPLANEELIPYLDGIFIGLGLCSTSK